MNLKLIMFIVGVLWLGISHGNTTVAETPDSTATSAHANLAELLKQLKDPAVLNELIEKLENTEAEDSSPPVNGFSVKQSLGIDGLVDEMVADYREILKQYGIGEAGFGALITILISAVVVILLVTLNQKLSYVFDRKLEPIRTKHGLDSSRFKPYFRFQRIIGYIMGVLLVFYSVVEISTFSYFLREYINVIGIIETVLDIFLIIFVFVSVWELVNAAVEVLINRSEGFQSSRANTLIPILRNLLMFIMLLLAGMVVMSELGIDIVPLLAGAGVLGIAIGFGAQKLVKDFINGFTVILEDLLQIGDVVTLAGRSGAVEKITIRKIQLRDLSGIVYTIPFGDVDIVENLTKEFSFYLLDIGIAYREDTDQVIEAVKQVDQEMRDDPDFGPYILDPIEVLGVDKFADSAVIIKARIKTPPKRQWMVGREFNRRMKYLFDKQGIEIPFPHRTLYFGEDKSGQAPKAYVQVEQNTNTDDRAES